MNNQQDQAKQFEKELKDALSAIPVKDNNSIVLPDNIDTWWRKGLSHESIASLGLSPNEYCLLVEKEVIEMNVFELSFIINSIQSKTPEQLNYALPLYVMVQKEVNELAESWNQFVVPIKTRIGNKIRHEFQSKSKIITKNKFAR